MAKTIDDLILNVKVEGKASISETTTSMNQLDAQSKKTNQTMGQTRESVRNVAFQVQDLAVQVAGGTSAFVALGQQLPQLLSGFGIAGAVIGALAAVSIPLVRVGLSALGVDMRDLNETTQDLTTAVKNYQDAQSANLPSLRGLGTAYGGATDAAKAFFEIQEALTKTKVGIELKATLADLMGTYQKFTKEAEAAARAADLQSMSRGGALGALAIGQQFTAFMKGLTVEQAKVVAETLKDIDKASPEQAVETLNNLLTYLQGAGVEAPKLKKFFEETIEPLLKINNQILAFQRNITEANQRASNFAAEMMILQSAYLPDIGNARRAFNQVSALEQEAALKIEEYRRNAQRQTDQDRVDRSLEIAAFEMRTNTELSERIKDIAAAQLETFRNASLTNEARTKQLALERSIVDLRDKGLFATEYNLRYDEEILRISKEYDDTLKSISEQLRRNQITSGQALALEVEAGQLRDRATENAGARRAAEVRKIQITQEMDLAKKSIEEQISLNNKLGEAIQKINDQRVDLNFERTLRGLSPLQKEVARINEAARKSALDAQRAFASQFGEELNPEQAQQLADGLTRISEGYRRIAEQQLQALAGNDEFMYGLTSAFEQYRERAMDTAGQISNTFNTMTSGLEDAFVKFAQTGKLEFEDMANAIIADLIRIAVRRAVVFAGSSLFGFPIPGMAKGGPVFPDKPYIVGEQGPELFIPKSAGDIVPNNSLQGGTGGGEIGQSNVTYNINAVDAASFRALVARDPAFIYTVTEQGRRSQPMRTR